MSFVVSVRHCALLALAAGILGAAAPARAIELRDLAGWWVAIDDTFPRLWQQNATAAAEEVLQINHDGRVQDRSLNFWAGSAQTCLEHQVCSDLPVINHARLRVAGDKISFQPIVIPNAAPDKLDTGAGDAAIRAEAITATADWTAALAGDRLTLRRPGKVRVLARIEPARLRQLHAGMRVSGLAPAEHWRCFLTNATARDDAFAPLRAAGRAGATLPDFLDRYLSFATYITAIRSTLAIPAIDESDEERRKRLGFNTEEQMVQHFDTILRPPRFDDRPRLRAVLDYVDAHTRTTIAYDAAASEAAGEEARSNAAATDAARLLRLAREAAAVAEAARGKTANAAAESEKAQRDAAMAAIAATTAAASARDGATAANARQATADAAGAAHKRAQLAAETQRRTAEAAARTAEAQRRKSEAADASLATRQQALDTALRAVTAKEQMAGALGRAMAPHHQAFEQTARELAESYTAFQRSAGEAAAALLRGQAAARHAAEMSMATASPGSATPDLTLDRRAVVADTAMQDALHTLAAARDRARTVADAAAAGAAVVRLEADAAAQTEARDRARTAAEVETQARDKADADAQAQTHEHARLADAADTAAKQAGIALDAAKAAHAASAKAKVESEAATHQASHRAAAAQTAAKALQAAQDAERGATVLHERAKAQSDTAGDVAAKAAAIARHAAGLADAAREAMRAAAATQPRGEGFIPITTADIAALAQVVSESDAARKLFCRGEYAGGPHPAATTASATPLPPAAPARSGANLAPAPQNSVDVPLPLSRPQRR